MDWFIEIDETVSIKSLFVMERMIFILVVWSADTCCQKVVFCFSQPNIDEYAKLRLEALVVENLSSIKQQKLRLQITGHEPDNF